MQPDPPWVADVLDFWFDKLGREGWFAKDDAIDAECRNFAPLIDEINARPVEEAMSSPSHALASILVLDQFTRNIHRDTPRAFAYDELARGIARLAVALGLDSRVFPPERRVFFYLPFEHSEAYPDQLRSVELISTLGDEEFTRYAEAHCDVIARFGRFPHRNAILGRESTPEELAFLEQPGSSF
jgi:uncharacterized protein (DUF924 family)